MRLTQEAFLARVAQDGMLEREAGRLALERSGSPEVTIFRRGESARSRAAERRAERPCRGERHRAAIAGKRGRADARR